MRARTRELPAAPEPPDGWIRGRSRVVAGPFEGSRQMLITKERRRERKYRGSLSGAILRGGMPEAAVPGDPAVRISAGQEKTPAGFSAGAHWFQNARPMSVRNCLSVKEMQSAAR